MKALHEHGFPTPTPIDHNRWVGKGGGWQKKSAGQQQPAWAWTPCMDLTWHDIMHNHTTHDRHVVCMSRVDGFPMFQVKQGNMAKPEVRPQTAATTTTSSFFSVCLFILCPI